MSTRRNHINTKQPMTVAQALEWVEDATDEVRELRMRRFNAEWPEGHREREQHRPKFAREKTKK